MKDHSRWFSFRKALSASYARFKTLTFGVLAFYAVESSQHAQTFDAYIADQTPVVQIISETTPFPHMALRIDRRVYSYGVENMSVETVSEYMLANDRGIVTRNLPRSVQTVTLNLSETEKNNLIQYLEAQRGKTYMNKTLVNDCSSMMARALRTTTTLQIPDVADASPAGVISYLTALKIAHDKRVGQLGEVSDQSSGVLLRNLWINSMDIKVWASNLAYNYPYRVFMDFKYKDEIQYRDETEKKVIAAFYSEVQQEVETSIEIQGLKDSVKTYLQSGTAADRAATEDLIRETIQMQSAPYEEALSDPRTELQERTRASYALSILMKIQSQLLTKINTRSSK